MDRKLILQLLLNKTEEIQSLLQHFKNQPDDLKGGLDLLSYRIEGLERDFDLLKKNFSEVKKVDVTTVVKEEVPPIEEAVIEHKTEAIEEAESKEPIVEEKVESPVLNGEKKEENQEESSILNDQLQTTASGVLGEQLSSHRLKDVQSAIGINDRFLFIRELFDNNADAYNSAIDMVNQSPNYTHVENWIKENGNWDMENPTVNLFIEIVKRKF
ncbi:MAG: hypothetical protein N4A59_09360 [Marinifilum sp.]|jgi:hypothetical protein|nr:hypothetical protein [Marinifilum sp.]